MGIYRRAKIPWAVVHPCQTVINVSKDRYLLWSRCSSFLPACSLAISLPPGVSLLSTLLRARGERSRALPTLVCFLYSSPPFYRGPPLPLPPSFLFCSLRNPRLSTVCRFTLCVSASCSRPSFLVLPSLRQRTPPVFFLITRLSLARDVCFEFATRFSLDRNERARRVLDARVAWLLKFPHNVMTFVGYVALKNYSGRAALRLSVEWSVRTYNCSGR